MKTIYRVNWSTKTIETAKLLDENHLCNGASVETWLCKDSNNRKFVCSKFSWQFSELAAWHEYEAALNDSIIEGFAALIKARNQHEEAVNEHLRAKQKIKELELAE